MKKCLFILLLIALCPSSQVRAGQPYACTSPGGNCYNHALRGTDNGTVSLKALRGTTNAAFFNFEESPRTPPVIAQPRGASMIPVSILETDMEGLMVDGNFLRIRGNIAATATMNIGVADNTNPQTWTVPTFAFTESVIQYFIAPSAVTPASAQVLGAEYVSKTTLLDENAEVVTRYKHYIMQDGDELDELGSTYVKNGVTTGDYDEAPSVFVDAPLDLGDAFMSSLTSYDDDDPLPRLDSQNNITVDAFGTINTPLGTFDCLRMRITVTQSEYTTDPIVPSSVSTYHQVAWVTKEGFRFYALVPSASSNGTVTVNNFTMLDMGSNTVLPIELVSFTGKNTEGGNKLTWTTANEKNNAGFEIQRSLDGKTFENIGFVAPQLPKGEYYNYTFYDKDLLSTTTYYRLRQLDVDDKAALSNVIALENTVTFKGLRIYPNPSNGNQISLELTANTEGVVVTNSMGQTVFQQKTKEQPTLNVDVSQWATGVYFIKSGEEVVKFIKN